MKNFRIKLIFQFIIAFAFVFQVKSQDSLTIVNEYISKKQFMQALQILEKMKYSDSLQMNILEKKAICFQKLGQIHKAKNSYNLLLTLKPDSQDFLNEALSISIKQGNVREIIEFQKKLLLLDSTNAFYLKEFGKTMFKIKQFDEGIITYKKALKYNSDDLEGLTDLANVYLNRGEDVQAIPLISRAYSLDSNMVKVRQLKARLAYKANDFKEFIKEIEFTMIKGDTTAHYQRLLGNSYLQINDLKKSKVVYERLIATGENSEIVMAGLGYVAVRSDSSQFINAFINFHKAIDLGTSDRIPEYKMEIADIHDKWGETNYAIHNFKEILDKYQLPFASYRLAEIYENKKNDKTLAAVFYQEYIRKCNTLSKPDFGCRF